MTIPVKVSVMFHWIPKQFGGHSGPPYESMRTEVVWQRNPERTASNLLDVEWSSIDLFDEKSGTAEICFNAFADVDHSWTERGEILEFRNGFRLLAIGCVQE